MNASRPDKSMVAAPSGRNLSEHGGAQLRHKSGQKKSGNLPKTDARHWLTRLFRTTYSNGDDQAQIKGWLLAGLRKREIDTLLWDAVKFDLGQIHIQRTEYFEPKSKDSEAAVDCDAESWALLSRVPVVLASSASC